jgi:uncharacterized phosphosugar-binding protein
MSAKKSNYDLYLERVQSLIKEVQEKERENIFKAAEMIAESLARGELLHVFGCAHSALLAQEIFYRTAGLVQLDLISALPLILIESATDSTWFERLEGYAARILDKHPITPGEIMLIISTSGRNSVVVEMALEAKKRGLKVIALTSLAYSNAVKSRHSSGKKLFELADIVIDNHTIPGDAIIEIRGVSTKVGPTSLVVGSAILHALIVRVIEIMVEKGLQPLLWHAANMPGGDEYNTKYIKEYKAKIRHL